MGRSDLQALVQKSLFFLESALSWEHEIWNLPAVALDQNADFRRVRNLLAPESEI